MNVVINVYYMFKECLYNLTTNYDTAKKRKEKRKIERTENKKSLKMGFIFLMQNIIFTHIFDNHTNLKKCV